MARGRSLFGDPTSEIQELTQVIKQDLSKLNSDIADLQQRVKSQSYGETKHMRSHSSSVVVSLQSKLVDLSKDFKGVLEVRTEVSVVHVVVWYCMYVYQGLIKRRGHATHHLYTLCTHQSHQKSSIPPM